MAKTILTMQLLTDRYGVSRLNQDEAIPSWATGGEFFSITRTEDELSLLCELQRIPEDVLCERDWRVLKVEGPLDFALVGILAAISQVLAQCSVSIFAVSTYDTDYILMKEKDLTVGIKALREANYQIIE